MTKFVKYYFIFGAFLLSFPFLLSQNLPFAYWDWLMVPYYQLQGDAVTLSKVPQNLFFSIFLDRVQFRPLATFLTNLQYVVFKGEFWAWYLIRWLVFGLTIYLIYKIVIEITKSKKAAFLSAVFFMLHPMPLVKDVLSQDAYVTLFASLTIFNLVSSKEKNIFKIDTLNKTQYSLFLILFICLSFSKEIAVAFTLPLTALILFNSRKHFSFVSISKTFPFIAILGFSIVRILEVNHPMSRLNQNDSIAIADLRAGINGIFDILFPNSPFFILSVIILSILLSGLILCIIRKKYLALFCLYGVGLCLSVIIIAMTHPCPKYLPTPTLCLSMSIGFASAELFKQFYKSSTIIIALFCLVYPLFTLPNIYSQWFAMQQSLYEMSDIIQFMYQKNSEGYILAVTGLAKGDDIPWEKGATFSEFFKNASSNLYGRERSEFFVLSQDGIPPRPFVLLTSFPPDEIRKGQLAEFGINSLAGFTSAYEFERNHFGFFAKATESLKKFEQFIGSPQPPTIGCASPMPSTFGNTLKNPDFLKGNQLNSGPHLLYLVDPAQLSSSPPSELEVTFLIPNRKFGAFGR